MFPPAANDSPQAVPRAVPSFVYNVLMALRYAFALVLFATFGLGLMALSNWLKGTHYPLWLGPIFAVVLLAMTALIHWCRGRGLITSLFFTGREDLALREEKLANDRLRIIAEAKRGR